MGSGAGVDELRCDADLIGNTLEAAFDDILRLELSAQLLYVYCSFLVGEGSVASQYPQLIEATENSHKFIADAIREKFLARIAGEIVERKHRDGGAPRLVLRFEPGRCLRALGHLPGANAGERKRNRQQHKPAERFR